MLTCICTDWILRLTWRTHLQHWSLQQLRDSEKLLLCWQQDSRLIRTMTGWSWLRCMATGQLMCFATACYIEMSNSSISIPFSQSNSSWELIFLGKRIILMGKSNVAAVDSIQPKFWSLWWAFGLLLLPHTVSRPCLTLESKGKPLKWNFPLWFEVLIDSLYSLAFSFIPSINFFNSCWSGRQET